MFRSDISLGDLISLLFDEYMMIYHQDEERTSVAVAFVVNEILKRSLKSPEVAVESS